MSEALYAKCACAHCGTHLEFAVESVGVVIACPHCAQDTELTMEAPPPAADQVPVGELLASFNGSIKRPGVPFFYQLGLILVTAMMFLMPLVYAGMVTAAVWGIYWYGRNFAFHLHWPGIFHRDQPARTFFSHFDVVAKQVTHLHYSEDLGLVFDAVNLRPVREREG